MDDFVRVTYQSIRVKAGELHNQHVIPLRPRGDWQLDHNQSGEAQQQAIRTRRAFPTLTVNIIISIPDKKVLCMTVFSVQPIAIILLRQSR